MLAAGLSTSDEKLYPDRDGGSVGDWYYGDRHVSAYFSNRDNKINSGKVKLPILPTSK
jgi:hypothetical protein